MFSNFTGWHALIILAVVIMLFGATRLPALAKAVGQSTKIFKSEVSKPNENAAGEDPTAVAVADSPELTQTR